MMSAQAIAFAVQMGYHRSCDAWKQTASKADVHEIEMRKRVFWSILTCHITVGTKLGRPHLIRPEDYDVELPELLHDNLPSESGESDWRKCSYRCGITGFRWLRVESHIYSSLYGIKGDPKSYESTVKRLSKEIDDVVASFPPELAGASQETLEDRVFSLYVNFAAQHMRLLLYHPGVCRTQNPDMYNRNLDICLHAGSELLRLATDMKNLKSLDTTWFNTTVFIAAMFTTLFISHERKDQMTSADLNNLHATMDGWLDVFSDVGNLLGSGPRLKLALGEISTSALDTISKHLAAKTASAAVASVNVARRSSPGPHVTDHAHNNATYQTVTRYTPQYTAQQSPNIADASTGSYDGTMPGHQHGYAAAGPYAYPEPGANPIPSYNNIPFDANTYNEDIKPDLSAHFASQGHHGQGLQPQGPLPSHEQQAHGFIQAYGSPHAGYTNGHPHHSPVLQQPAGSVAWRQFADNMKTKMTPHWSANALMSLGHGNKGSPIVGAQGIGIDMDPNSAAWPMVGYDQRHGSGQ